MSEASYPRKQINELVDSILAHHKPTEKLKDKLNRIKEHTKNLERVADAAFTNVEQKDEQIRQLQRADSHISDAYYEVLGAYKELAEKYMLLVDAIQLTQGVVDQQHPERLKTFGDKP